MVRYFEAFGSVRQAISVVKKRTGSHERTVRELRLGPGVQVGKQLQEFQGILSGSQLILNDRQREQLLGNGHG
jgi:circadian clock protein KaiC